MASNQVDRNLLFGFLALQNGSVSKENLLDAINAWLLDKSQSVEQIMRDRRILADADIAVISALTDQHLVEHRGGSEQSLGLLATVDHVREGRKQLSDPEITTSHVPISDRRQAAASQSFSSVASPELHLASWSRYRVLRPHAKGGLGQVYVAQDLELNRDVALKEIQPHRADDPVSRMRFVLEAEITGGLEHPGIVPVYGFGNYEDGRPYYAMRFIRGDSLKEAIAIFHKRPLNRGDFDSVEFRSLLGRFTDVCNAIEYAHSRGVLHRDLKPGNIMLGKYGETLVVDWGLARAKGDTEPDNGSDEPTLRPRSGGSSAATQTGSTIGTPAYMSPEQAAGKLNELGPAADIYSLGATLYSVLTGSVPFQHKDLSDVLRMVKTGDFPRPRDIQPLIPKPLEAICLKAMAVTPQDRYRSAAQLAQDLERWLADETTTAYRESAMERARRWAKRNRSLVQFAIGSISLLALTAVVAAYLVNGAREREAVAKVQAESMYLTAQGYLDRWLPGISEVLRYAPGGAPLRERLLNAAAEDYQNLARHSSAEPRLELERGRTLLRLGEIRRELGKMNEADAAFQLAETHFQGLARRFPMLATTVRIEEARAQNRRGALFEASDNPQALVLWRETVKALSPAIANSGSATDTDRRLVLASARVSIAEWLERAGQLDAADQEVDAALSELPELPTNGDKTTVKPDQIRRARLTAFRLKARIEQNQGKLTTAREMLQAAVLAHRPFLNDLPPLPSEMMTAAELQIELASVFRGLGLYEDELTAYSAALPAYRELAASVPDSPDYQEAIALTLLDRGQLLLELSHVEAAGNDLQEALHSFTVLRTRHQQVARFQQDWAAALEACGRHDHLRGNFDAARTQFQQAIRVYTELSANRPDVTEYQERSAIARSQLARALAALGETKLAEEEFGKAFALIEELAGLAPAHPRLGADLVSVLSARGGLLFDRGEHDQAMVEFRKAIERGTEVMAKWPSPGNARVLAELLVNCPIHELRDPAKASTFLHQEIQPEAHDEVARAIRGWVLCRTNRPQQALDLLDVQPEGIFPLASAQLASALALQLLGQPVHAQREYDSALATIQICPGEERLPRLATEAALVLGVTPPRLKPAEKKN